jgi:hypothetical protein
MADVNPISTIGRYDAEDEFECSRCHRLVSAECGSSGDEIDVDGTWCDDCWHEVAHG